MPRSKHILRGGAIRAGSSTATGAGAIDNGNVVIFHSLWGTLGNGGKHSENTFPLVFPLPRIAATIHVLHNVTKNILVILGLDELQ